MVIESRFIHEPKLFFGGNESTIDPKVGLMNFGPYSPFKTQDSVPVTISAGVISTEDSLDLLKDWLDRLCWRIEGQYIPDSNVRGIDFPGLSKESPLKFELLIDESCIEIISKTELESVLNPSNRKDKIVKAFELYKQKFSDMSGNPPLDIVLLPIPNKLMNECQDKRYREERIVYERRTFDKSKDVTEVPLFDFHNALKVIAFKYGIVTQIIRPKTLIFSSDLQDASTIAWNFAVATYYKGTEIPWKLANIDENACFVGISFYEEISKEFRSMRTSMAHVYMKTGESQVIRGNSFPWDERQGLSPILPPDVASEIMKSVLSLYERQKGKLPRRVVVHKSSPFTLEEISGFDEANSRIEIVDYVHIAKETEIRAYPDGYEYPILRGTMFGQKTKWFLFTTGFIPSLGTYPGSTVPKPLMIEIYKLSSTPYQISKDIMALTKLDWNTADFCRRVPVTLSVSKKVGNILSEMRENDILEPPSGYRYYM